MYYHFDKCTQKSILLDTELELSDLERKQIVSWIPKQTRLFKKDLIKDHKIFRYIRYHGEIRPTIHPAVVPADITEEELSVTDNSSIFCTIFLLIDFPSTLVSMAAILLVR